MHGAHHGKNDAPVSPPGGSAVHPGRLLQGDGDVHQITGIQHDIHRHIEHHIEQNHAEPVGDMQLRCLLCQGHHQDGEGNEHTADDEQVYEIIKLAVGLVPPQGIAHQGMNGDGQYDGSHGNQQAVPQGTPEIRYLHGLPEIVQAPVLRQGQYAADAVGHLRRLLESDYNGHVQRKNNGGKAKNQQYHNCFVGLAHFGCMFHSCSSFELENFIWATEMATITMKNTTALALWNPNCPPDIPLL